jgi:hypothetical protein
MSDEDDRLQIVSHFPGRLRVRARKFHQEPGVAEAVAQRVGGEPGVLSASASAVTGSILILYDPRKVQVDALITALLSGSGLLSLTADAEEHADGTALATHIRQSFVSADTSLFRAADGRVDLRTAIPGVLAVSGFATLLFKAFVAPQWYDLVFWSYVTFNNLNLVRERTRSDAR